MYVHSETLNPCNCGSEKTPVLDSDDMVPSWAVNCPDCGQMHHDKDWTHNGAVLEWNSANPILEKISNDPVSSVTRRVNKVLSEQFNTNIDNVHKTHSRNWAGLLRDRSKTGEIMLEDESTLPIRYTSHVRIKGIQVYWCIG